MKSCPALALAVTLVVGPDLLAGDDAVVISEIQYHPHGNDPADEFLELENRGERAVDLSGWVLARGIRYVFPSGVTIDPGDALVVSPNRAHTIARYGLEPSRVVGDYRGRLDNGGEVVLLLDAAGRHAFRVRYRDEDGWPETADGTGPSLELLPGFWDPYLADSWRASLAPAGTPGEPFREEEPPFPPGVLSAGSVASYFVGREEPSPDDPLGWSRAGFDDRSWPRGPEPFGFGEGFRGTTVDGMEGNALTLYARFRFPLDAGVLSLIEAAGVELVITVDFDDGFVLFVNGTERLRANAPGRAGRPVPFDASATREERSSRSLALSGPASGLEVGENVIALQGLDRSLESGGFLLGATARLRRPPSARRGVPEVRINEVGPPGAGGQDGFIEIHNRGTTTRDLSGHVLAESPYRPGHVLPDGSAIRAGAFLVIDAEELPFPLSVDRSVVLLLDDRGEIADVFPSEARFAGRSAARYPDGGEAIVSSADPTPGAPNRHAAEERVVINEIHYHPAGGRDEELEFVEIHNRSDARVALDGWSLDGAVTFLFPDGAALEPGAYLVIASDPDTLRAEHGLDGSVAIAGPFEGRLANDEERLVLRDPAGNPADSVPYADDGAWPEGADGRGPSLELIHPLVANEYGILWREGPDGGTPGTSNRSFTEDTAPHIVGTAHHPPLPGPGEDVTVSCRVIDTGPVEEVRLEWTNDTWKNGGVAILRDGGAGGDVVAGDATYTTRIPAQPDGSTVRFRIVARDGALSFTAPGDDRYYLYEVNGQPFLRAGVPHYTILMTEESWREIRTRGNGSDRLLDGTFVDHQRGEFHYNVGVRYRGNGSRNPPDGRFSYRVRFSDDRKFLGLERLNFNSQNAHRQILGNDFFRRSGIPYPVTVPVVLRLDGSVDERYAFVEAYDEHFLDRFFGDDDGGNLYRGLRGRLGFQGDDPEAYRGDYRKITNEEEDDFSDLIELTRAFTSPDPEVAAALEERLDVFEWVTYFAAQGALGNNENSINLDAGDDYYLYARPSDGRFEILPWDTDSVFVDEDQPLFRPSSAAVARFLRHPRFAPLYYCILEDLRDGCLKVEATGKKVARLAPLHRASDLASISDFVTRRQVFLDRAIPRELTVEDLPSNANLVIAPGDEWAYWPGTSDPSGGDLSWTLPEFDDGDWPRGPSGFGYGDGDDATVIDDMQDNYATVFVRRRFRLDRRAVETLTLRVDYDDAFVAYLNGAEIARRNYDRPVPRAADTGVRDREAGEAEPFPVDPELLEDENVLAIVVLNGTLDSSDLSLIPSLEVEPTAPLIGCEDLILTPLERIALRGRAPACATRSVLVNGAEASYTAWEARWGLTVDLAPGENVLHVRALDAFGSEVDSLSVVVERSDGIADLGGSIDESLVLDAAGGPYRLTGETIVSPGTLLEIGPGALILAGAEGRLVVGGRLLARGSAARPVTFRPDRCGGSWSGIRLEPAEGPGAPGGLHLLEHCAFLGGEPLGEGLVEIAGGRAELRSCRFAGGSGFALAVTGGGEARAFDLDVTGRTAGAVARDAALHVEGSRFESLDGDGIVAEGGEVSVAASRLSAAGAAVRLRGGRHGIAGSLLHQSGTGASVREGASLGLDHATIADCATGVEVLDATSRLSASSIILWANATGLAEAEGATAHFEYSDIQDRVPPGAGNLSADPLFVAPESGDYRLRPGSPALGAGKDGTDMGAFGSRAPSAPRFIRGDADASGDVNLTDAVVTLLFLFSNGRSPACEDAADTDDDGRLNLTDAIITLVHLFQGGRPPAAPYPDAGVDPTPDDLGCLR